ncbi:hypothetical protein JL720_7750 [Aureococcus anophagefferens]|nr:hypothetical protein JL720_7750 [Aureococcus anophagefferens]
MPKRAECVPPQGVELIVVRGTGNKFFAEDVLDQLSYFAAGSANARDACADASTWRWTEARSVAFVPPATVAATPRPLFALPTGPRAREAYVAILRHPILRVASRYWFEGRWPQHAPEPAAKPSLGAWVNATRLPARQSGGHLWNVPDDLYTKQFAGWRDGPMCHHGSAGCRGGLAEENLEKAIHALATHVDALLITEWLAAPGQIEWLARKFCFATDGRGGFDGATAPSWWHFPNARRAGGGHHGRRPAGWAPDLADLELLVDLNSWDLRLFASAADTVRRRIRASAGAALADALPALAPSDAPGLRARLRACPAPTDRATAC